MAKQPKMDGAQKLQGQTTKLQEKGSKEKAVSMFDFSHLQYVPVFVSVLICVGWCWNY